MTAPDAPQAPEPVELRPELDIPGMSFARVETRWVVDRGVDGRRWLILRQPGALMAVEFDDAGAALLADALTSHPDPLPDERP